MKTRQFRKTILLGLLGLSLPSLAKKPSCEDIKPAQSLTTAESQKVAAGAAARVAGTGAGQAQFMSEKAKTYETKLLGDAELAQAWFKYTQCVETTGNTAQRAMALKEMGMTPDEYAQWATAFQTETSAGGGSLVFIGATAAGVGAALGAGTYFYGKNNNEMDEGPWGVLNALNVTGWAMVGAGAGMITYSMFTATSGPTIYPTPRGLGLSGRF